MFQECSSLINAPALKAETLAESCYGSMFFKCSSLIEAPALPATTLAKSCYHSMFAKCSSLMTAPALAAETLASSCYLMMFADCTSLTTGPELPAQNLMPTWYSCYKNMFKGCSKLKYVVCKVDKVNNSAINSETNLETLETYFENWLSGVSRYGILITPHPANFTGTLAPSEDTVTPSQNWKKEKQNPLTLEAVEDGTITVRNSNKFGNMLFFKNYDLYIPSNDNSTDIRIDVTSGDKICIFADGLVLNPTSEPLSTEYLAIHCGSSCYLYGNIMSLVVSNNYGDIDELDKDWYFYNLFSFSNNKIMNHPTEPILLPATTLTKRCYSRMFATCSLLSKAPELPAKTLKEACYRAMFAYCDKLTEAPELKAETLAKECYCEMFQSCRSLTTAPNLPATTLAEFCYSYMFKGCTSLETAPELPATALVQFCYAFMFDGCSKLTIAPVLPATTLEQHCYEYMFRSCTRLNYIKCLASPNTSNESLTNWTSNVSRTGTFVKKTGITWPSGASGIPTGWTQNTASQ